jgi:hypothetical protein
LSLSSEYGCRFDVLFVTEEEEFGEDDVDKTEEGDSLVDEDNDDDDNEDDGDEDEDEDDEDAEEEVVVVDEEAEADDKEDDCGSVDDDFIVTCGSLSNGFTSEIGGFFFGGRVCTTLSESPVCIFVFCFFAFFSSGFSSFPFSGSVTTSIFDCGCFGLGSSLLKNPNNHDFFCLGYAFGNDGRYSKFGLSSVAAFFVVVMGGSNANVGSFALFVFDILFLP